MFYVITIGVIMGLANLIPGVSGGTIVLLGGLYERFVGAVASLSEFKLERKQLLFLVELFAGVIVGLLAFSSLIELSLTTVPSLMYGIFCGLVVGSIPVVLKNIKQFPPASGVSFTGGVILVMAMAFSGARPGNDALLTHSLPAYIYDLLAGFVGAAAMVLPGLSGAFVLLLMGEYSRAISAINDRDLLIILFIGLGVVGGIVLVSKILKSLMKKRQNETFSFLLGLMIGSIPDLLTRTGEATRLSLLVPGVALGVFLSYLLAVFERKNKKPVCCGR
jgi:putative membrane protein